MKADTALRRIMDRMEALQSYLDEPYTEGDVRRARAIVGQVKRLALRGITSSELAASGKTGKSRRSKKR